MSKGKLAKFAEMETFPNVLQPKFNEVLSNDFRLKGKWNSEFFKNSNPITLELGCGKGEYTVGLAEKFPNRNFIGIDIKGSRIWKGAKEALKSNLLNAGFLRTRIDFINSFFSSEEVEEIWITFPDPQLRKQLKRLTSSRFLNRYRLFLKKDGFINLKTDNEVLFLYTKHLAEFNNLEIDSALSDVYASDSIDEILSIKTYYEKGWLKQGLTSKYIRFKIDSNDLVKEPPDED